MKKKESKESENNEFFFFVERKNEEAWMNGDKHFGIYKVKYNLCRCWLNYKNKQKKINNFKLNIN